jgi:hypothetical protein
MNHDAMMLGNCSNFANTRKTRQVKIRQVTSGERSSCDLAPLADVAHQLVAGNMPF